MPSPTDEPRLGAVPPAGVRIAGAIWLAQGGLILLAVFAWLSSSAWRMVTEPGMGAACCDWWVVLVPGLLGWFLARVGLLYVTGAARDTLAVGIGSILLGAPLAGGAGLVGGLSLLGLIATWGLPTSGGFTAAQWLAVIAILMAGTGWLAAGVLLVRGRRAYLSWKQRAGPGTGGRLPMNDADRGE